MRIVGDQRIPFIDEAFVPFGELVKLDSRAIDNSAVRDADAVIVRSETKVDEKLLSGSKVRFVGTATIGIDHVDLDFLKHQGITFASAPGSNSNAVVQYVFAALFTLAKRKGFVLKGKTLGVVGVGNIGSKIVRVGKALGMNVQQNDPPLARATGDPRFVSLDDLMQADFITIHVPFTRTGSDPTFHLFDAGQISRMKKGSVIINSSRGGVVDNKALKDALNRRTIDDSVLDVWENEPNIDTELLSLCAIGTPHIAGYSIDGKVNATKMIYEAFCEYFRLPQSWDSSTAVPRPEKPKISIDDRLPDEAILSGVIEKCYDIERDDEALRKVVSVPHDERGQYFKGLRGNYHFRHELSDFTVTLHVQNKRLTDILESFGLRTEYVNEEKD